MRTKAIAILVFLALPLSASADSGPVVPVTKEKQPEFIKVNSVRLKDGSTKFEVILKPYGGFKPDHAYLHLKDGERFKFTARLDMVKDAGKDQWRIEAWADDDSVQNGHILLSYGNTTGPSSVSRNWSIAFGEFASE